MAGIRSGLKQLHRNPEAPQTQAEGEAGESAPDDLDGFYEILIAEKKWVKGPADFSCKNQPEREGQRAPSSLAANPASTLTRAS